MRRLHIITLEIRKVVVLFLISLAPGFVFSQQDSVKNWKVGGDISFSMSQITLKNWSAGGKNSTAGNFMLQSFANYSKNKNIWSNALFVGYGWSQQQGYNVIKTDDRLLFTSKYGYKASKSWYYSALVDFKTQMTVGYDDPPENTKMISDFMAPAYLLTSLGMDYKPNEHFSLYISPLTFRMTFVLNDSLSSIGAYGVDPDKNFRGEYGAYLKSVYKKENILKNLDLHTRLDLFSNLLDKPQNIVVDGEIRLNYRFTKYLTAVAMLHLMYDDDVKTLDSDGNPAGPKLQTKQMLGFGISFKF